MRAVECDNKFSAWSFCSACFLSLAAGILSGVPHESAIRRVRPQHLPPQPRLRNDDVKKTEVVAKTYYSPFLLNRLKLICCIDSMMMRWCFSPKPRKWITKKLKEGSVSFLFLLYLTSRRQIDDVAEIFRLEPFLFFLPLRAFKLEVIRGHLKRRLRQGHSRVAKLTPTTA